MAKNEKILDEHGIRLLIRLISGIKSNSDLALSKCIDLYDSTKVYNKNDICVFDNKLWLANTVVTNTEPSFTDTAHWISLDDEFNEIGEQDIEDLMQSVSESTWDYLKNILSDQISTTHAWNSSTSYAQDQATLQSAKDYTDQQVSKSLSKSYVVVNDLSLVQEDKYIYLVEQGDGSYLSYVLGKDGNPISFGDPNNVNLEGYAKTEDIANEYAKSSDLDSKFATITTTDGLRTDLNNHKNNIVAHLTQEERDKLVTTDVLGDYAKTVDLPTPRTDDEIKSLADGQINAKMTTTINSSSTDTQVPSAKSVYDKYNIHDKSEAYSNIITNPLLVEVSKSHSPYNKDGIVSRDTTENLDAFKLPVDCSWGIREIFWKSPGNLVNKITGMDVNNKSGTWINVLRGDVSTHTWSGWQRLCITKVADVPWTQLTMGSGMRGSIRYCVKNGFCYVNVNALSSPTMSTHSQTITSNLPVPELSSDVWYTLASNNATQGGLLVHINSTGKMINHVGIDNASYYGYFSYPVAES